MSALAGQEALECSWEVSLSLPHSQRSQLTPSHTNDSRHRAPSNLPTCAPCTRAQVHRGTSPPPLLPVLGSAPLCTVALGSEPGAWLQTAAQWAAQVCQLPGGYGTWWNGCQGDGTRLRLHKEPDQDPQWHPQEPTLGKKPASWTDGDSAQVSMEGGVEGPDASLPAAWTGGPALSRAWDEPARRLGGEVRRSHRASPQGTVTGHG